MRRGPAIAAALTLAACQPVFYDLIDSAGAGTTTSLTGHVPETTSETTGPEPTGDAGSGGPVSDTEPPPPPPPSCDDGLHNGFEEGVDCGGPLCAPCKPGPCQVPEDCDTLLCVDGQCLVPQCEFAKDCPGEPCRTAECDPLSKQCVFHDLDGLPCEDGDLCTQGDKCIGGACLPGFSPDCSGFDGPCQLGFCNPKTGNCGVEYVGEGMPCEDGFACTVGETCSQGQCFGKPMPPLFFADFSDPAGWVLDEWWQIGPAVPSQCAELGGEDPFDDHSPGPDQMLAGAVIGGCLPNKPLPQDACLMSPAIDATVPEPLWLTFFSRSTSPPDPAEARVEVWDGQTWVLLFSSLGQPFDEPNWTEHVFEVSPFKSPELRVRFCHHLPVEGPVVSGWSVDDVMIGLPGCFPP